MKNDKIPTRYILMYIAATILQICPFFASIILLIWYFISLHKGIPLTKADLVFVTSLMLLWWNVGNLWMREMKKYGILRQINEAYIEAKCAEFTQEKEGREDDDTLEF